MDKHVLKYSSRGSICQKYYAVYLTRGFRNGVLEKYFLKHQDYPN
jgi:hypothetical protein